MAEKACHVFGSATQVGLTQALGCTSFRSQLEGKLMQGSLLASFGFRTLAVLRAVSAGTPIIDATKERLQSFGFATVAPDGTASLTILGLEMLAYLESIALVPEEHVEFIEAVSGPGAPKKASGLSR